jgi:hypothetical protein
MPFGLRKQPGSIPDWKERSLSYHTGGYSWFSFPGVDKVLELPVLQFCNSCHDYPSLGALFSPLVLKDASIQDLIGLAMPW